MTSTTIYVDSRAAISALAALRIKSKTVSNCILALNKASDNCDITIRWIKAHSGHCGNEYVDSLAKLGTKNTNNKLTVLPPISWANLLITQAINKAWNTRWKNYNQARQTKIWFPTPNCKKSLQLLKMGRKNLSRLVQFLTGHNKLKRHKNIQNGVDNPQSCRLCEEEEESSFHVIAECPATQFYRWNIFQNNTVLPNPPDWTVSQVDRFLKESPIGTMLDHTTSDHD